MSDRHPSAWPHAARLSRSANRTYTPSARLHATGIALLACLAATSAVRAAPHIDHHVQLTPENSAIGNFPAQKAAILTVRSGETVRIDTGGGAGWRSGKEDPAAWLKRNNVPASVTDPAVQETLAVWEKTERFAGIESGHLLVGPIAIEGAMPGDSLEIRILSVVPRIPWGTTGASPGRSLKQPEGARPPAHVTVLDVKKNVGHYLPNVDVPLGPFMGVMGVQPAPAVGPNQSSSPPGDWGGNLDCRELVAGTTLYLPVHVPGARFFTGDAHAAQGDGEITGTAIETANTVTLQFILHTGKTLKMPRAETPTHYIAFGLDADLENAMQQAVDEAVAYVDEITGWTGSEQALPLLSMGADFHVTQIVDFTKGIHAMIPKKLFAKLPAAKVAP
jgi:acetamidase/formamidase